MKFNRFSAFTLGVLVTTVSVSAVTYVNASSNSTIKACANKKTGAMRYIAKGKCKKTEKALSWNQMGPQGLPGAIGTKGDSGTAGTNGTNGQNLYVIDANGDTLGRYLGVDGGSYLFTNGTHQWFAAPYQYGFHSATGGVSFYTDALCSIRLIWIYKDQSPPLNLPFLEHNQVLDSGPNGVLQKSFVINNTTKRTFASYANLYGSGEGNGTCTALTSQRKAEWDSSARLLTAEEIAKPSYTAPLTIVAK